MNEKRKHGFLVHGANNQDEFDPALQKSFDETRERFKSLPAEPGGEGGWVRVVGL